MFGRFSVGYGCGDDDLVSGFCKVSTHGLYSGTTETFKYYISIVLTRLSVLYIAKKMVHTKGRASSDRRRVFRRTNYRFGQASNCKLSSHCMHDAGDIMMYIYRCLLIHHSQSPELILVWYEIKR